MSGWIRRFGLEPGERTLFAASALALLLLGWADVSVQNASETLFLKRVGFEHLPIAFLVSSFLLVVTTTAMGRLFAVVRRTRLLPMVFVGLALLLMPLWWGVQRESAWAIAALLIVAQQIKAVSLLVFWVAIGDLLHSRQAKRLAAPLTAGLTLGTILGSFLSDDLGGAIGIEGLVLWASGMLALAGGAALVLGGRGASRLDRGLGPVGLEPRTTPVSGDDWTLWRLLREHPLFRVLAVTAVCAGFLGPILYLQVQYVADQATLGAQAEGRLLSLLAALRGWLNLAVLGAQLVLASHLYRRLGLPLTAALSPIVYLLGFTGLSAQLTLPVGVAAFSGARLQEQALGDPGRRVLYALFPETLRSRTTALLDGPLQRLGGALGNGTALATLALGGAIWLGRVALPVALVWLGAALWFRRQYPALLLRMSAGKAPPDVDVAALLDRGTLQRLGEALRADEEPRWRAALGLLAEAPADLAVPVLADAAVAARPEVRPELVAALDHHLEARVSTPVEARAAIPALLELWNRSADWSEPERADLVQALGRLDAGKEPAVVAVLEDAAKSGEPAVRLAARASLHHAVARDGDLDAELARAVATGSPAERRTAREELRALLLRHDPVSESGFDARLTLLASLLEHDDDRAETADALADVAEAHGERASGAAAPLAAWRDEPDPALRAAILRFVGAARCGDQAPWVVSCVGATDEREAREARDALISLGPLAANALLTEHCFGPRRTRDAILGIVRELPVAREDLVNLCREEVRASLELALRCDALERADVSQLLLRRLEERIDEGVHTALLFLTAIHDEDRLLELDHLLRTTAGERERAILLEALEALLEPEERRALVPLIERRSHHSRARAAAEILGTRVPTVEEAKAILRDDPDELTRALLETTDHPPQDDESGLVRGARIARELRQVGIFEFLSVRQLIELSERAEVRALEAGATVFTAGSPGPELFVVTAGLVEVRRGGVVLERAGPGGVIGGDTVFADEPREADAVVVEDATLVRVGAEHLEALIQQQPSVAISLCQSLASRVRDLTERVAR